MRGREQLEKRVEGCARRPRERKPEHAVQHDVARFFQSALLRVRRRQRRGVHEGHAQGLQLRDQPRVDGLPAAPLRVAHGDAVPEVEQVARGDEPVAAVVARTAHAQHAPVRLGRVHLPRRRGDGKAGELHELLEREPVLRTHEFRVDLGRLRGTDVRRHGDLPCLTRAEGRSDPSSMCDGGNPNVTRRFVRAMRGDPSRAATRARRGTTGPAEERGRRGRARGAHAKS